MRLMSEDVRSIRGVLLFVSMTIEEEPSQALPRPGASCQAGSCRRVDRRLSIPNGQREIAGGIINICCIAVKLRAIHFIVLGDLRTLRKLTGGGCSPLPKLTRNQPPPMAHIWLVGGPAGRQLF